MSPSPRGRTQPAWAIAGTHPRRLPRPRPARSRPTRPATICPRLMTAKPSTRHSSSSFSPPSRTRRKRKIWRKSAMETLALSSSTFRRTDRRQRSARGRLPSARASSQLVSRSRMSGASMRFARHTTSTTSNAMCLIRPLCQPWYSWMLCATSVNFSPANLTTSCSRAALALTQSK